MHVVRGQLSDPADDRAVTRQLTTLVADTGEPAVRAWTPPRQVAFGRRDATANGYERARAAATERGYTPIERSVGGHAIAHTGETVAFAYVVSDNDRSGIQTRYQDTTGLLKRALETVGVTVRRGEPDDAYCPGEYSLQHDGKIAGIAQRVRRDAAVVGGCVTVRETDEADIAAVLVPVYDALCVPFDPDSVGSVEGAGGPADPRRVTRAIESVLVGGRERTVHAAENLLQRDSRRSPSVISEEPRHGVER